MMSLNAELTNRATGLPLVSGLLTPGRSALLLVLLAGLLVALWPLGISGDYLNHLARNHIEGHVWFDAALQENYAVSFAVIPDLTMDLIVPWLSHLIGTYAAGAVTVWIALILPPLAGMLISKTLYGRATWLSLVGFLTIFNENIQWGFVNFNASTGLALIGFAFWMRSEPRWRRALLFAPFGVFLALNHALAFLLFGYLVLLWEIAGFAHGQRGSRLDFLRQLLTIDAVAMAPGLVLIAFATLGSQELPPFSSDAYALHAKLSMLWSAMLFFNSPIARIVGIVLVVGAVAGLKRGYFRVDTRMVWVCVGMLALVVAMPVHIFGIWGLHYRFPAILIILVASCVRLDSGADRRWVTPIAAVTASLLVVVFVSGAWQMARNDRSVQALRGLISAVPEGSRILSARQEDAELIRVLHATTAAVIDRSAFVPNLFTNTSPVDVKDHMRALHLPQAWPLLEDELRRSMPLQRPEAENGFWSPRYFYGWPDHWDYLVFYRTDANQRLDLAPLCMISQSGEAVLYKIEPDGCPGFG